MYLVHYLHIDGGSQSCIYQHGPNHYRSMPSIYLPDVPQNWTAQKRCAHCCIRRDQTRADPQDSFFAACAYGLTEIVQDVMGLDVYVDVNGQNKQARLVFRSQAVMGMFSY